jgi:hypothetical protein
MPSLNRRNHMKRIILAALSTAVLAISAPAIAPAQTAAPVAAASTTGCPDGYSCVYEFGQYLGERLEFGPSFNDNRWAGIAMVGGADSAKNRYDVRTFAIADGPPGRRDHSDCIPRGGNRPAPAWHIFYVKAGC